MADWNNSVPGFQALCTPRFILRPSLRLVGKAAINVLWTFYDLVMEFKVGWQQTRPGVDLRRKGLVSVCLKFCSERVVLNVSSFLTTVIRRKFVREKRVFKEII